MAKPDVESQGCDDGDRATLRLVTSRIDRAHRETQDPESAPRSPFGAGWTVLDQFEADGTRFVVLAATAPFFEPLRPLTAREREVMSFAAMDYTNKQIAYELGVTAATVRVLLARAAQKLGAKRRHEAIAKFRAQQSKKIGSEV